MSSNKKEPAAGGTTLGGPRPKAAASPAASAAAASATHSVSVSAALAIEDIDTLYNAISNFVRSNANFESSIPVDAALSEIGACRTLAEAFPIPLQRQLFSMDTALTWVLFLHLTPQNLSELYPEGTHPPPDFAIDPRKALDLISKVYDVGVEEAVHTHFEEDEEDDEEDSEEDSESEETASGEE